MEVLHPLLKCWTVLDSCIDILYCRTRPMDKTIEPCGYCLQKQRDSDRPGQQWVSSLVCLLQAKLRQLKESMKKEKAKRDAML
jgi:hypothetical protein